MTDTATPATDEYEVVARRNPWQTVATVLLALFVVYATWAVATNPHFEWGVVAQWLTARTMALGALLTVGLTVVSMVLGVILGVILAVMRMSGNPLLSSVSGAYIWFFRGTPLLIQLIFWFNLSALVPVLRIGLPLGGPTLYEGSVNSLVTPLFAALLGLTLNEAAYMAEIVRGGLLGVDRGQTEAASALGLGSGRTLWRIILPQAMRIIVPPTGNQVISMLKNTSLVSVLGVGELLHSAQIVYSRTFQTIPLLIVASLWYLLMTTILGIGQRYLERHFGRGQEHSSTPRRRKKKVTA
ncbi:amino acid ABC transporter permease [Mobilicoccus caccae]|uniref:ABC transporter permease n=1 Tax=Mobilicoccus caccae TaxID=1859295 RepID=A0ABQ6IQT7_9MICO|nr:amino acid ABC transporter permease [Mobilicoccus caccae]GMA40254.1 ABC transporter permease [Mobilicoccus caccae]